MGKVEREMKPSPQQKQKYIADQSVCDIAAHNECNGEFDIFRVENITEFTVNIANVHIDQGIDSKYIAGKHIHKHATKKAHQKTCKFSLHKPERSSKNHHQVWNNPTKADGSEYCTLQNKTHKY